MEPVDVSPTAGIDRNQPGAGVITVDGELTEAAEVGGEVLLTMAVTNAGPRDIQQLTVIVNLDYVSRMIVLETQPNAIRHSEQGGEYFIFGPLATGQTGNYVIRMSPLQAGEFDATIDVAELSPIDMTPLRSGRGGPAEFTAHTEVVEP